MKRLVVIFVLCLTFMLCAICFTACSISNSGNSGDNASATETVDAQIKSVYNMYVASAEAKGEKPISYEEWLATIKGEKGEKGEKGDKGDAGTDGKGIDKVYVDEDGWIVVKYTDGTEDKIYKIDDGGQENPEDPIEEEIYGTYYFASMRNNGKLSQVGENADGSTLPKELFVFQLFEDGSVTLYSCLGGKTVTGTYTYKGNNIYAVKTGDSPIDFTIKNGVMTHDGEDFYLTLVKGEDFNTNILPEESAEPLYKRVNENDEEAEDGNYIYFGYYPQSDVTEEKSEELASYVAIKPTDENDNDWTSYEYYISGSNDTDYMWYKDVDVDNNGTNDYRAVYFTSYRPYYTENSSSENNSHQDNNGYNTSTVYWFEYEPVKWRILSEEDGTALILAELILDSQDYNYTYQSRNIDDKTVYGNNYEYSSIRAWLNDNFYNTAFNELEQALILTTIVDNSARSTNPDNNATRWNNGINNYACENTEDKIFLLSQQEVTTAEYGFSENPSDYDTARRKQTSDYAKAQGAYTYSGGSYDGNGYFWLRSPYYDHGNFSWFVYDGGRSDFDCDVYSTMYGVVPALQISLGQD